MKEVMDNLLFITLFFTGCWYLMNLSSVYFPSCYHPQRTYTQEWTLLTLSISLFTIDEEMWMRYSSIGSFSRGKCATKRSSLGLSPGVSSLQTPPEESQFSSWGKQHTEWAYFTTGFLAQSVKWIETNLMCLILLLFLHSDISNRQ